MRLLPVMIHCCARHALEARNVEEAGPSEGLGNSRELPSNLSQPEAYWQIHGLHIVTINMKSRHAIVT